MMTRPESLRPGDTIAVISPATTVKREYVEGAAARLREMGFVPRVMPHACGPADGTYAASVENRLHDFLEAWRDPEVKCVLCARGGYGAVHLLPRLSAENLAASPKWLVGFSDISALHALMQRCGIISLHASMAKHLALFPEDDPATAALMRILCSDNTVEYSWEPEGMDNHPGQAEGILRGGNLAVLDGLAATPYDILDIKEGEEVILFIEDIAEPIYKVERILMRLYLSGALHRARGLVAGQFTEYRPDANFATMEAMISCRLREWGLGSLPVAFNAPTGHIDGNLPLPEGYRARLDITPRSATLSLHP